MTSIAIIGYLNFAGALLAFFIVARVIALDGRGLRSRRGSWALLLCSTALLAALLGVQLFLVRDAAHTALQWAATLLESALVISLVLGCFYLFVREHQRVAELYDTAETHSRRSRRLEAILRLSDELRTARGVQAAVDLAAGAVMDTLAYKECALYLLDEESDVYCTRAALGGDPGYNQVLFERPIPGQVVRDVLRDQFRQGSVYLVDHTHYSWTEEELFFFPPGDLPSLGPGHFHADDALFVPLR